MAILLHFFSNFFKLAPRLQSGIRIPCQQWATCLSAHVFQVSANSPEIGKTLAGRLLWGPKKCISLSRIAGCRKTLRDRARARTSSTFLLPKPPMVPGPSVLSFPPSRAIPPLLPRWMPQAGSGAGPGPRHGSFIGGHAGKPCEGGHTRGRSGLSRAPARTAPNLRRAVERCGWVGWENRLLAMTDVGEEGIAVAGQSRAPKQWGRPNPHQSGRSAHSAGGRVTWREPRCHVAGLQLCKPDLRKALVQKLALKKSEY